MRYIFFCISVSVLKLLKRNVCLLRALVSELGIEAMLVVWKCSYTCSGAVLAVLGSLGHSLTLSVFRMSAQLNWLGLGLGHCPCQRFVVVTV